MLGLLLVEVSGKGDDIGVDVLAADGTFVRHFDGYERSWRFVKLGYNLARREVVVCKEYGKPTLSTFSRRYWQRLGG